MNVITLAGRLAADAETRVTPNGQKLTTFRMAVNVRKGGKDETMWWRVTVWGDRYEKMVPYFKKGTALIVVGEMQNPTIWTDKEGRPQVSLEVTAEIIRFNGNNERSQEGGSSNQGHTSQTGYGNNQGGASYQQQQPAYSQPQQNYGNNNNNSYSGDFGGSMQGGGSYSQPSHADEDVPF